MPLCVKFIKPLDNKKVLTIMLAEDVLLDNEKVSKLENILSKMFFIGLQRADEALLVQIKSSIKQYDPNTVP